MKRWLNRFDAIARRGHALADVVRRHERSMVFLIRFAPGLRIALAAACAYAEVAPLTFSLLNGLSSIVWGALLLALVAWAGPTFLPAIGISGWWSALVPAVIIIVGFRIVGQIEQRALGD